MANVDRSPNLPANGVSRRTFLEICSIAAAAVGLPASAAAKIATLVQAGRKPSVVWLSLAECTGCTESLLRTSMPALDELILDLISLDYHEALMAPSGELAHSSLRQTMEQNAGSFILVVEGAVQTADGGIYCKIGGETALELLREVADAAGVIVAIGSCASWGGIPSADPNPTGAQGVPHVLPGKTVVTIPGCPPNPYNFLGTVLQYATFGTLPTLDGLGRPKFAFARTIHEHCPRRAHFDAGRFVRRFGDEGHQNGWCLYELGCKGPQTYANCPTRKFGEIGAWPIGIGHPCFGCTEQGLAFRVPLFETVEIQRPTPPDTYPSIASDQGGVSPAATAVAGAVAGAAATAAYLASRKLGDLNDDGAGGEE